jgi:ankyrin repeat protein
MDPFQFLLDDAVRGDLASVQARLAGDRSLLNASIQVSDTPYTVLAAAAGEGHVPVVEYLLGERAEVNDSSAGESPALCEAVAGGHEAVVRLLLGAGADVGTRTDSNLTLLMMAAFKGHAGVMQALLAHGCGDLNARSRREGETAVLIACREGHTDVVRLLLGAGAHAALPGTNGLTPLMYAAEGGHVGVVQALVTHGCGDLNARDEEYGLTALSMASLNGHGEVVKLLLGARADWSIANSDGFTALHIAHATGKHECAQLIKVRTIA